MWDPGPGLGWGCVATMVLRLALNLIDLWPLSVIALPVQCTVHCTLYTHTLQPASQGQEFFAPWQMSFLFHLISSDRFKDEWRNSKDFSKQKSTLQIKQSVPSLYPETLCKSLTTPMCVTICDSDYQDHGQTFIYMANIYMSRYEL